MRIKTQFKSLMAILFLVSCVGFSRTSLAGTGRLWFGGGGPGSGTASGVSDDRVGYLNSDGTGLTTVQIDSATNSFYCVGLDTNANLWFGLAADGSLHSSFITTGTGAKTYSGTTLSGLAYVGQPGDAVWISGPTDISKLYTADAGRGPNGDSPAVYARGPFGTLGGFSATYQLLAANVPPGTSPYWIVWLSPPGDTNSGDDIAVIQYTLGNALNNFSTIHVIDPSGRLGSYQGATLAALENTSAGSNSYTFGQMTVQFAGVEIGNWGVSDSTAASAYIESMAITYPVSGIEQTLQVTDVAAGDLAYSFAVDPSHHLIYMGLWGDDSSGADLIEIPYDPATGQMTSPYDSTHGEITDQAGVLLSFVSTGLNFVMARQMWVAPGGGQIYYVDNDFGDPGDYADNIQLNGVYVVDTTETNPQPQMLSLASQFPGDNSEGYIVGLAVNPSKNVIYFATAGFAPGVGVESNTIWSMPITGGVATAMPLPSEWSLVFPNYSGGCLALDSAAQTLYVSDQGRGTVLQLSLSADGLKFTGGASNFFTLDSNHLSDNGGYPSAFVQGLVFDAVAGVTPPAAPRLTIARDGPNVVLSWPAQFSNYALQFAGSVSHTNWENYPGPFATNNSVVTTTNGISGSSSFFRLSY